MSGRVYLDLTSLTLATDLKLMDGLEVIVAFVSKDVRAFCHGYNTCFGESMHNKRTRMTNKRKRYDYFDGRAVTPSTEQNWGFTAMAKSAYTELQLKPPGRALELLAKCELPLDNRAAKRA